MCSSTGRKQSLVAGGRVTDEYDIEQTVCAMHRLCVPLMGLVFVHVHSQRIASTQVQHQCCTTDGPYWAIRKDNKDRADDKVNKD